ncbi:MAG TPA: prefoldin subunit alpha [Candidatus Pacearchaeota archaeon]|nr:prefoldin subunit alpha [Candidatus Pacearchaeota archaeon]
MKKENQEIMIKLGMFEQQIQQLRQQSQAVEESIIEITALNYGLGELEDSAGKEILAPLGRGIFVKTKLLSDKLTVDVGGRNFVKKSIPETKKIIENQIKKLNEIKEDLNRNLEEINQELIKTISEAKEN